MGRGFAQRIEKARTFENFVLEYLQSRGFHTALNGTEHTHPKFVSYISRSNDQTSLSIRFQPDAVACTKDDPHHSFYVEAKAAKTIERTAYEQYMRLCKSGSIVIIIFQRLNNHWNFIENIRLIDGHETVTKFPERRRYPVHEDGWIYPREHPQWNQNRWHRRQMAGTPYREVDPASTLPLAMIKVLVGRRFDAQE